MTPFRFFHLKSIGGQIAALVVASIVALHLILTVSFLIGRPDRAEPPPDSAHQLADAALLLSGADASERPRILADIARAFPKAGIELLTPGTVSVTDGDGQHLRNVRRHLGHQYKVLALAPQDGAHRIAVQLPDGTMIAGRVEQSPYPPRFWGGPWIITLLFALISVTVLGLWAAYALAAPLSSFAKAAENFSLDVAGEPLPERGPEEMRSVARPINAAISSSYTWGRDSACAWPHLKPI